MSDSTMSVLAATVRVGDVIWTGGAWWDVIGTRFATPVEGQVVFTIRPAGEPRAPSRNLPPVRATVKVSLKRS